MENKSKAEKDALLRNQLKIIQIDSTLSAKEKSVKCQALMSGGSRSTPICMEANTDKECTHYKKLCSNFVFECCNKLVDPCNRCHMARECCSTKPPMISSVMCNICETVQTPGPNCINCDVKFSHCFCNICKIWTSVDIFHCNECGLCRVGKEGTHFHCSNCEACFPLIGRENHQCAKQSMKYNVCCYCLESVHSAQKQSSILTCCGTVAHSCCMSEAAKKGNYRCPHCRKSLAQFDLTPVWAEMRRDIRLQPLPQDMLQQFEVGDTVRCPYGLLEITQIIPSDEGNQQSHSSAVTDSSDRMLRGKLIEWTLSDNTYAVATVQEKDIDKMRLIKAWCNDCERNCVTQFHFIGLECRYCRGFNTSKA